MSKEESVERFYKCCINVPNPNSKEFAVIDGKRRQWMCRPVVPIVSRPGNPPKEIGLRPIGAGHGMIVCCDRSELKERLTSQVID